MGRNKNEDSVLTHAIIQLIKEKKPLSVQQLVNLVEEKTSASEQKIIECISQLQSEGKVMLKEKITSPPRNFGTYLRTNAYWYWMTIILSIATALAIFMISEDVYPIVLSVMY